MKLLTLSHILLFLSFIKNDIYLVSSKHITYALTFGSIIHNGLILLSFLYPIRYWKPFLPYYETLQAITILSLSTSFTLIRYLDLWNVLILTSISKFKITLLIFYKIFFTNHQRWYIETFFFSNRQSFNIPVSVSPVFFFLSFSLLDNSIYLALVPENFP